MQSLPHTYQVIADAAAASVEVRLSCGDLPQITTAPPLAFGGPGDRWSPEDLLVGAVADCFILSFKAIARASKFDWQHLDCQVNGVLDRVDKVLQFTHFEIHARLQLASNDNEDRAKRLLEKAEQSCLVTNSMTASVHLSTEIVSGK